MDSKPIQPSQKRRAILQGSLAAPVVLTVATPSLAQATTFGRCLTNQAQPAKTEYFTTSADNWMRASVNVVEVKHGNEVGWYFKDSTLNDYVRVSDATPMGWTLGLPNGYQEGASSTRMLLYWVDNSGNKVLPVRAVPPGGCLATTYSCYGTFHQSGN